MLPHGSGTDKSAATGHNGGFMASLTNYDDILCLQRPTHLIRHTMTNTERAAQFSPFSALTGFDDAVEETARLTDPFSELNEDAMIRLNTKLLFLAEHISLSPEITVTAFFPDTRKSGGAYKRISGTVQKLDEFNQTLHFSNGIQLPMKHICEIEGSLFPDFLQ